MIAFPGICIFITQHAPCDLDPGFDDFDAHDAPHGHLSGLTGFVEGTGVVEDGGAVVGGMLSAAHHCSLLSPAKSLLALPLHVVAPSLVQNFPIRPNTAQHLDPRPAHPGAVGGHRQLPPSGGRCGLHIPLAQSRSSMQPSSSMHGSQSLPPQSSMG